MWKKLPPMHFAAMTYSLARSCLTSVRTTLAMLVQLVSPMTSAMLHALGVLILWMLVNTLLAAKAFDPYPFILLDLVLSCVAAIQAPLIMMSQNRQEEKDRRRAENDYKVNLKAEIMIEDLYDKVNAILARQTALEKQLTEKGESAGQK